MSMFSPPSSFITALTRIPLCPTHEPTGSIFWSFDETATLLRKPASRAIAFISTTPLAISGTSSSKSFSIIFGCFLERIIAGPRLSLSTLTTKTLNLCPILYRSCGICSSGNKTPVVFPISKYTVPRSMR